uniref:Fringe-like glycosyltransferase domain-containing protein n=1 Tax=Ciona intestinalis TaxID=7719 RepID=F6WD96_CIOIN
ASLVEILGVRPIHHKVVSREILFRDSQTYEEPAMLTLDDIFITVKTSKQFHCSRLGVIVSTWFAEAKNQTYFITDGADAELNHTTNGHVVPSKCATDHSLSALSCKLGVEYDTFMKSDKKWWCRFDDDNYVNVKLLVKFLREFNWKNDLYIGRRSRTEPFKGNFHGEPVDIFFTTGGAGVCISSPLANKMKPWAASGEFLRTSQALGHSDDCTVGFIIINRLKVNLTESILFHSHMELLSDIPITTFREQITFSHRGKNIINITPNNTDTPVFDFKSDPTRFLSLHCHIHPAYQICKQ